MDALKKGIHTLAHMPTLVSLLAGSGLLLWQAWAGSLPESVQLAFFALLIFLTGIPHGALDHLVEKENARRKNSSFHLALFLLGYLLTMLSYGLMWYLLPGISLLFFLLMSAWHFGETDIEHAPPTRLWQLTRFVAGALVLMWILLLHAAETGPILARISQNHPAVMYIWSAMTAHSSLILLLTALGFGLLFYAAHRQAAIVVDRLRSLQLLILLLFTGFLPLLPAFALYFGGWHALCSFQNIHTYLHSDTPPQTDLPQRSPLHTWVLTLPFTALACVFLLAGAWYWLRFLQAWDPLPLIFIFLSLITLPHLNVMHRMSQEKSSP